VLHFGVLVTFSVILVAFSVILVAFSVWLTSFGAVFCYSLVGCGVCCVYGVGS